MSSFATSVGISSSDWWAAGHHPLDEAEKGLQGFAAEMFSGRTRIIGEQEKEAGRAYLGGWRPPGAADVLPEAGEDGRSGVEVGGPERVGAAPGVERQVQGHPKASCIAWQPEGGRYTAAWSRRATVVRQEAGRGGREKRRRLHTFRLTGDPIWRSDFDGASTGRSSRGRRAKTFRLLEHRENSRSN